MFIGLFSELIKSTCVQSLTKLLLEKDLEDLSVTIHSDEDISFVFNIVKNSYVNL